MKYAQASVVASTVSAGIFLPALARASDALVRTTLTKAQSQANLATVCASSACLARIVGQAIQVVLGLIGVALLGYLLYAGFLWMTARGETDQIDAALKTVKNAVIGIAIIGLSYTLTSFVLSSLNTAITGPEPSAETPSGPTDTATPPEEASPRDPWSPSGATGPYRAGCIRSTCYVECSREQNCRSLPTSQYYGCERTCRSQCDSWCQPTPTTCDRASCLASCSTYCSAQGGSSDDRSTCVSSCESRCAESCSFDASGFRLERFNPR